MFPNGATVIYNVTDITDGDVAFAGRSLGGSSIVADADVVDAMLAGEVVAASGVGDLGQVELDRFLADADVAVGGAIGPYTEGFVGSRRDARPRGAVPARAPLHDRSHESTGRARQRREHVPTARRGSRRAIPARRLVALYEERYGDEPRLQYLPSPEDFATLDAAGVERCGATGSAMPATGCSRSRATSTRTMLVDLARRYVGTLPATGRAEHWVDVESPPPAGIVERTVEAGTGAQGALNVLYTVPVESIDPLDVAAAAVVTQLLSTRLTDDIREALGESYSPFAAVAIDGDRSRSSRRTCRSRAHPIGSVRSPGSSRTTSSVARRRTVAGRVRHRGRRSQRDIELFSDAQLIDEILKAEVDGVVELEDFADQGCRPQQLTIDDVRTFVADDLPADHYIEITVVPR